MTKNALRKDKERMDEIAERIAFGNPVHPVTMLYWQAVAIGHILEWIVTRKEQFGEERSE